MAQLKTPHNEVANQAPSESTDLRSIIRQLADLLKLEPEDDFGPLKPNVTSALNCMTLISQLASGGLLITPTDISTDRNGDLRVQWAGTDGEAELVFPYDSTQPAYLFHMLDGESGVERNLNIHSVAHWIKEAVATGRNAGVR